MDTYEINLSTLTYGGDALGRLPDGSDAPGLAVFVPLGLPGERVRVQIVEQKRGHARSQLLEVLTPSPDRIAPRCPHFGICGGCHYQHMPYEAQLAAKTNILRDQLERIGRIENPPIQEIIPSPQPWNYRNYVQFHLTDHGKLGFEGRGGIVEIEECHLPEAAINVLWPQLDLEPLPGLERIGLRVGDDGDLLLSLHSDNPFEFNVEDLPLSAVQVGSVGSMVLAGSDHTFIDVAVQGDQRSFRVSAESFFQVNTPMAAAMVAHILTNLTLSAETVLVDVYCGVGLFSAFLAAKVGKLIGIEVSPSACEDFAYNLDEFDNVDLYQAEAVEALPEMGLRAEIGLGPNVILVDPPRAGLDSRTRDAILHLKPRELVYISCDPATLGRDARHLIEAGYRLRQITPFDLFPQTYHIESISFWEC